MGAKLYVRNLPYSVTEGKLQEHFAKHGNVVSARIIIDKFSGRSKGFGFVEMASDQEAQEATAALNGTDLEGSNIVVSAAGPQEQPQSVHQKALELVQQAMTLHMGGQLDDAIRLYKQSIALYPTADAHTYLGWVYSFQGRINEAIGECEIAIQLDPEFGNPYNDIGVYLMQQQRLDDAIPWLERAKTAKRYEPRQFPHVNLGRIYYSKGMINKALEEFRGALRWDPSNNDIAQLIEELESKLQ